MHFRSIQLRRVHCSLQNAGQKRYENKPGCLKSTHALRYTAPKRYERRGQAPARRKAVQALNTRRQVRAAIHTATASRLADEREGLPESSAEPIPFTCSTRTSSRRSSVCEVCVGMNIGQASKEAGITLKMIRYYESIGLLPEAERRTSGYRDCGSDDVSRLKFLRRARSLGFSVPQIHELMRL